MTERPTLLHKPPPRVPPNLTDDVRASFSWESARALLDGNPAGGLNIAHEAVDRHAAGPRRDHVALRWISASGERRDFSYGELAAQSARFANVLRDHGVAAGDRMFLLMPRVPELTLAVLGALKAKAVVCPLFSAFGPEPIAQRMTLGNGKVLVTTPALYRKKVLPIRDRLPELRLVLLVGGELEGCVALEPAMAAASDRFTIPPTDPEDMALLHFTSGTTGMPKGAVHVHAAVLHHHVSGLFALDMHPEDVFWCTADPGWVTGTSYGVLSPLTHGLTSVVYEGEFDTAVWYEILRDEGVSVWYTAPTAVRMMMRAGAELARGFTLPKLRFIASVGEPLNPEAVWWGLEAFQLPIHDNWWQSETGGILIANTADMDIKPGSMGRPLPGIEAGVVRVEADGAVSVLPPGEEGELAIRPGWPSMFRAYLGNEERYRKSFAGGWYLSGDLARIDEDGYVWFIGRADDVIKTSGHLVGPFEVESALIEHPAVVEAAVIGKPDEVAGNVLKAFVSLRPGYEASEELRRSIIGHARSKLGAAIAPRELEFVAGLPRTRSGKIMRRLLKARELGLPEGDLSTLESDGGGAR